MKKLTYSRPNTTVYLQKLVSSNPVQNSRQHFFQALEVNGLKQRPQPTGHIAPSQNQDENQEKSQAENADSQDAQPQWKIIHVQHVIHTCRII